MVKRTNEPPLEVAPGRAPLGDDLHASAHMSVVTPTPYDYSPPEPEKKRMKPKKIVGIVLIAVAAVLLVTAAGLFADAYTKYDAQDQVNAELATHAVVSEEPTVGPQVDWAGLEAIDPNVCAWIQIPDSPINFPVYQGEDNDYYLNTNAFGEYGVGGQIFLDCMNTNPGMVDMQTIIYGHHLQNGGMFAPLADFDDQAVFDAHPTVWYVTRKQTFELEPLLCYRTVGTDQNVRQYEFPNLTDFHDYLIWLLQKAQARRPDAEQIIQGTEHVLTLSTCSYEENNGRTILVCVPKDEAAAALEAANANGGT